MRFYDTSIGCSYNKRMHYKKIKKGAQGNTSSSELSKSSAKAEITLQIWKGTKKFKIKKVIKLRATEDLKGKFKDS